MPSNTVKSFADKTGKSVKEVEKLWNKAKAIVKDEYPDVKEGDDKFYSIVVGILKKMLKINEDVPATTTNDISSYSKPINPISIKDIDNIIKKKKKMSESILERLDGYLD